MYKYSQKEKEFMLNLARHAIQSVIERKPFPISSIPSKLLEGCACFVTLTINGKLRGCIGHIQPIQELYKDIIENARAAAFDDPRFPPLEPGELPDIKIELSILTKPKPFIYKTNVQLLTYLKETKPGVIISKERLQATFLPQVWKDIPNPPDFLSHLCLKAGLPPDAWKHGVDIYCYSATKIM